MEKLNQAEIEQTQTEEREEKKAEKKLFIVFNFDHPILDRGNKIMSSIGSYLPVISVVLLGISLIRIYLYYNYFKINILDYINLTELLSPLLLDLASLIILATALSIALAAGKHLSFKFIAKNPQLNGKKEFKIGNKIFTARWLTSIYQFTLAIIAISLLVFPLIIMGALMDGVLKNLNIRLLESVFVTFAIAIVALAFLLGDKTKMTIHIFHFILISLFSVMFVSAITEGYSLPEKFYKDKKLHTTRIIFEDSPEPLKLDSVFVIGLTQDYVFLYHDKVKMPQVRKRSDIKVMSPGVLPLSNAAAVDNRRKK